MRLVRQEMTALPVDAEKFASLRKMLDCQRDCLCCSIVTSLFCLPTQAQMSKYQNKARGMALSAEISHVDYVIS